MIRRASPWLTTVSCGKRARASASKVGVTTSGGTTYVVLGDMNQQGSLSGPNCSSNQNGRGGLFYVIDNATFFGGVTRLIQGATGSANE